MDPTFYYASVEPTTLDDPLSVLHYYGKCSDCKIEKKAKLVTINGDNISDAFYLDIEQRELKSEFEDRSGIILANIDSVFNFTNCIEGEFRPRVYNKFGYNIINATIGSLKYLQYRSYNCFGDIIVSVDFPEEAEVDDRINVHYDIDDLPAHSVGIYLSPIKYENALILSELVINNGTLILQIDIGNLDKRMLFQMAKMYENVYMIRPISLKPTDETIFIIYKNKNRTPFFELEQTQFDKWIDDGLNIIINFINSERDTREKTYNYYKCFLRWRVPVH